MFTSKWKKFGWSLTSASVALLLFPGAAFAQADQSEDAAEPGVLIVAVQPESAAAVAGLRRGDVVLTVNGLVMDDAAELAAVIGAAGADATVTLDVLYGDAQKQLDVTLGERNGQAFLGVTPYRPTPVVERENYIIGQSAPLSAVPQAVPAPGLVNAETTVNFQVTEVLPASPAAVAGLQVGDLIVAASGTTFTTPDGLVETVLSYQPSDVVTFTVASPLTTTLVAPVPAAVPALHETVDTQVVTVTLAANPDNETAAYLGVRFAPMVVTIADVTANTPHGMVSPSLLPSWEQTLPAVSDHCFCSAGVAAAPSLFYYFDLPELPALPSVAGDQDVVIIERVAPDATANFFDQAAASVSPAAPAFTVPGPTQELQIEVLDDQI